MNDSKVRWALKWFVRIAAFAIVVPVMQVLALRWIDPIVTLTMLQRAAEHSIDKRAVQWVAYDPVQLPVGHPAKRAFVASEDALFYAHSGFDWTSICSAAKTNTTDRRRGGSTITQQVAKNVFLWQHPSYFRKAIEAYYTLLLETLVSKERILDVYLSVAETGVLTFGVQAASQRYYKTDASALTLQRGGQLAGVLPSPQTRPINGTQAMARARFVRRYPAPLPGEPGFERLKPPLTPACLWQD